MTDFADVAGLGARIADNVARAVKAPAPALRDVLVALLAGGHVLIEDHPGVGKTALARALARSVQADFARVQCTSDLLPSDVVGTDVFQPATATFCFRPGPIFAHLVLVDEINRAPPKTQSGMLECMQERQVTVGGETHPLAQPFLVLATQNPIEYEGTYPLPEAQLDRFLVRVTLGYPPAAEEEAMLADHAAGDRVLDLEPVTTIDELRAAQRVVAAVHTSAPLRRYVVALVRRTRADERAVTGASPRAGLMLLQSAMALAALGGRDHALPDDVQAMAPSVLPHRLPLRPGVPAQDREQIIADALARVPAL